MLYYVYFTLLDFTDLSNGGTQVLFYVIPCCKTLLKLIIVVLFISINYLKNFKISSILVYIYFIEKDFI